MLIIACPCALLSKADAYRAKSASVMFMAIDDKMAAILVVEDPIKSNTPSAIHDLQKRVSNHK